MGKTTNWESVETWQRVVAAILATGIKPDLKQAAIYYGCTYDTLENRFRKIKKEAAILKDEVETGERGEVTSSSNGTKKSTPRKSAHKSTPRKDGLSNINRGRITKNTPTSRKHAVKREMFDSDEGELFSNSSDLRSDPSFMQDGEYQFGSEEDMLV